MTALEIVSEKINSLPPEKQAEVIDFIDFLAQKENSRRKSERAELISQYAQENAGGEFDLDEDLEALGIESLFIIDEINEAR